jgi:hypothetical protein
MKGTPLASEVTLLLYRQPSAIRQTLAGGMGTLQRARGETITILATGKLTEYSYAYPYHPNALLAEISSRKILLNHPGCEPKHNHVWILPARSLE